MGIKIEDDNIGYPLRDEWKEKDARYSGESLIIDGHHVMERWETPYMRMLSDIVTSNGGNTLEVGYGMGISASFILKSNVARHTVVECHPDVLRICRKRHAKEIESGRLRVLDGFWEDVTPKLPDSSFDGILFDTYPLSDGKGTRPQEVGRNHFPFFKEAYRLLKNDGAFTYFSDEERDFSDEHLRLLEKAGFKSAESRICRVKPPEGCMYWSSDTILAPVVRK